MTAATRSIEASGRAWGRGWVNKVPLVTATFWVIKILSTTVGETFADYLTVNVGLGPAATDSLVFAVLVVALVMQLRASRHVPWVYWLTVVLVSIFGTQVTDFLTDTLGVSLYVSTGLFAAVLAVVFAVWYRQEHTLSITAIDTPRREAFYWGAILTTFALGTAAGDLATEALALGFRNGALIFGGLFLVMLALGRIAGWAVAAFWAAYVLTRPLGASIGDLLTQDHQYGGLGVGATLTSLLFFAVIIALVARAQYLANRWGVAAKSAGPAGGVGPDRFWAGIAAAVVALAATAISLTGHDTTTAVVPLPAQSTPQPGQSLTVSAGLGKPSTAPPPTRPVSALGDLTAFIVVVNDVQALVNQGDLGGGKNRIKDLEVAWDDAEAGLKPRSPHDWHDIDDKIDAALTALRDGNPNQADCAAALNGLRDTLDHLQGLK